GSGARRGREPLDHSDLQGPAHPRRAGLHGTGVDAGPATSTPVAHQPSSGQGKNGVPVCALPRVKIRSLPGWADSFLAITWAIEGEGSRPRCPSFRLGLLAASAFVIDDADTGPSKPNNTIAVTTPSGRTIAWCATPSLRAISR